MGVLNNTERKMIFFREDVTNKKLELNAMKKTLAASEGLEPIVDQLESALVPSCYRIETLLDHLDDIETKNQILADELVCTRNKIRIEEEGLSVSEIQEDSGQFFGSVVSFTFVITISLLQQCLWS